jgi:AraC-like DNA-binding protein
VEAGRLGAGGARFWDVSVHYDVGVSYLTLAPPPRLAGIVERLWRVEDADGDHPPQTICPDGCAEIVIHLADPMRGQPRHILVGQMDSPLSVMATGRVVMLGARFTPTGLQRVLAMPQHRLAGAIVPLDCVWHEWTRETREQIESVRDPRQQLRTLGRSLERLVRADAPPDVVVEFAVGVMRARGGPTDMDHVAGRAGISRRQLERRFRAVVGLSPSLYGRIVRFQQAFAAIKHEPGAAVAARWNFVDQAHLIREVRRFSGRTPTLLANVDGLTAFFANAGSPVEDRV